MRKALFATALALVLSLPAAASAQHMDINRIIASIGGFQFQKGVLRLDSAPALRVVRLSTLAGAERAAARLWDARQAKADDLRWLHSNLMQNWFARRAVANAGVSIDQIVAFDLAGDGAAVLYADDL